jgi:hypothetical protein
MGSFVKVTCATFILEQMLIIRLDIRSNSIFCSNEQTVKLADISYNKRLHGNDAHSLDIHRYLQ